MPQVEYIVDIATNMPAGEQTIAELDRLTANLTGAGKGAAQFQQAIAQLSNQLDAAKAASVGANLALAEGNAQYKLLEKAAIQAGKAEEKAANMGVVPPEVARAAAEATAAVNAYATKLKGLEAGAAAAAKKEEDLAKSLGNVKKLSSHVDKSIAGNTEKLAKLQGGLSALGGPVGALGSKLVAPVKGFGELSASMGSANAAALLAATGVGAIVVAVLAVTAALVAGTFAIANWAVGLADSKRNAALNQQALEALHPELVALRDTFASLHDETGAHADELSEYAGQLKELKVKAADIPDALRAIALSEAALGKGGAADFLADIKAGKVAVSKLSAEVNTQLGGVVRKQMLGLSAQSQRFHDNIGNLFGGLDIEPVLNGLQRLVALFDENTVAGQAIKFLFESVFQPLINQANKASIVLEAFALGFLIGLTKTYIALKPVIKAVSEFFGFKDTSLQSTIEFVTKAAEYIAPVFVVAVAAFAAFAAIVLVVIGVCLAIQVAIWAVIAAVVAVGAAIVGGFIAAWTAAVNYLRSIDLSTIGGQIIQGMVNGILGAGPAVLAALGGVVRGAITGAKSLLGIHSPSKVFAEIGNYTGEGFALGVDDTADAAQASVAALVEPPDEDAMIKQDRLSGNFGGSAASAASTTASTSTSNTASREVSGNTFNFYGIADAESALEMLREKFTLILEGDAATASGGEPEPAT